MGNLEEELIPSTINAMKVISYDTRRIIEDFMAEGMEESEITLDMVLSRIEDWAEEDISALQTKDIIYQDNYGEEL